jgi:tetratricopeptide (TPR) repeat protein
MFNKLSLSFLLGFGMLFLVGCGESQQDQSYIDHLARAKVYQDQGQYKAAIIEYKNAVKKSNGEVDAFIQYANMLNRLGQYPAALSLLEQVTTDKTEAYYVELANTFQQMKKYFSAEEIISKNLDANSSKVRLLLAENSLGKGDTDKALKLFGSLVSDPEYKNDAYLGKATALARDAKIDESIAYLKQVDQASSVALKSNILLAGIQVSRQQLEKGEATLTDLLSRMRNTDIIEPEKVVVLERLSYVLTRQGRSNEAYIYTKILSEAFPGSSEVKTQFQDAVVKMDEGKVDEAKVILLKILENYPGYNKAMQLLGVISYIEGDIQTASKYLSDSVDPEIANDMTRQIYAATNLKLNDPKKVLEILEPGIEQTTSPATLALFGLAAISDKQFEKGEKALLKSLELDKNNFRVRLALANYYRNKPTPSLANEKEQLEKAYEAEPTNKQVLADRLSFIIRNEGVSSVNTFIDKALSKYPKDYATNLLAGSFVASQQQFQKALDYFTVAINAEPKDEDLLNALFAKGRVQLALKDEIGAEKTFREVIKQFPENQLGYKGLLSVYLLKENYEGGVKRLEDYGAESAQLAPYKVLIESSIARKDLVTAKAYFEKASKLEVDELELMKLGQGIRYVEAVMAVEVKDFPEARSIVADLLSKAPENLRLLSFLVDLEIKSGQLNEATKILTQIENINPSHPVVNIFKSDLALANNDLKSAKTHLQNAWQQSPEDTVAEKLFRVLGALDERDAQFKHLDNWLEINPNSVAATLYKAINYQQAMQKTKAIAEYEKVIEAMPNNVMALNNLGWIYFEKNDDRSLTLLKKAVELAPENAAVLDSYGWVLAKNGKKQEGLKFLEKAHALAPDQAEIKAHLDEIKGK